MKVIQILAGCVAISAVAAGSAQALDLRQTAEVKAAPGAVWAKIGDWCAIKDWHPAIASCEAAKKGFRTLTLKDGGKIVEKLTKTGKYSYSYEIVESPLPVRNYKATLTAKPDSLGSTDVAWVATFDAAKGKTDADATAAIAGIFEAGLKSIKETVKYDAVAANAAPAVGAAATAGAAATGTAAAVPDAVTAAAARDQAKLKAREDRRKRLEAAKVTAMEKYAKLKATIAEKAKSAADSAKAAYEKAKAAMSAAMEPKAEPKKP